MVAVNAKLKRCIPVKVLVELVTGFVQTEEEKLQ